MAKIRLVHNQTTQGPLLLTDVDSGLPNEAFGIYRKQPVYLSYHLKQFNGLEVVEDTTTAGFVDLVPSDKVKLSCANGVIAGMEAAGLLTVIDIPTGAIDAPTISAATFDSDGDATSGADDGEVVITGTNFTSFAPDTTTVTLDTAGGPVTLTWADIDADGGSSISSTSIVIAASLHGAGTAAGDVTAVSVTANLQTASLAVTEI